MAPTQSVLILVAEAFFRNRIDTTLKAVGREPFVVDPEVEDLAESLLSLNTLGIVIDLEDKDCDAPAILEALRADPRAADWRFIVYSALEDEALIARGIAAGVEVIPRSTFAANLVRLMQGFPSSPAAPAED